MHNHKTFSEAPDGRTVWSQKFSGAFLSFSMKNLSVNFFIKWHKDSRIFSNTHERSCASRGSQVPLMSKQLFQNFDEIFVNSSHCDIHHTETRILLINHRIVSTKREYVRSFGKPKNSVYLLALCRIFWGVTRSKKVI